MLSPSSGQVSTKPLGQWSQRPGWSTKPYSQMAGKLPFARGYHIEISGGRDQPSAGILNGAERYLGGGVIKRNYGDGGRGRR